MGSSSSKNLWTLAVAFAAAAIALILWRGTPMLSAGTVSVIVQGEDIATVTDLIQRVGGKITHELGIINAAGAELTRRQRENLLRSGDVHTSVLNCRHDAVMRVRMAEVLQHHRSGPDHADWIRDVLTENVGRRTVYRFKHGRMFASRI